MAKLSFEARIESVCRRKGIHLPKVEQLEWGFTRLRIDVDSWTELELAKHYMGNVKGAVIVRSWWNGDGGYFEGAVWLMDESEHAEYQRKTDERTAYLDDWWRRWHDADDETRRLMNCGAIA